MRNCAKGYSGAPLVLLLAACQTVAVPPPASAPERRESIEVPLPDGELARFDLGIVSGDLQLRKGSTEEWVSGFCRFRGNELRPVWEVEEGLDSMPGLRMSSSQTTASLQTDRSGYWELGLSEELLIDLCLRLDRGRGDLDLGSLRLRNVELDLESSDLEVYFDRPNLALLDTMSVVTQDAELSMRGLGNAGFERLKVDAGSGSIDLDFHGRWERSAAVEVSAGLSEVRIRLPASLPVSVFTDQDLSGLGFQLKGGRWVNSAWAGGDEVHLALVVDPEIGSVEFQQY